MRAPATDSGALEQSSDVAHRDLVWELSQVIERHLPRFRSYALRCLRNTEDAEDAVQDGILSAYRHLGEFRQEAKISTWLSTIVLNAARMQLRKRVRVKLVSLEQCPGEDGIALSDRLPDEHPTPEDACCAAEMKEHLHRVLPRLSPPLFRTFHLRHVDGLSVRETATVLKVPEGTVKARLNRARRILQRHLAKQNSRRLRHARANAM